MNMATNCVWRPRNSPELTLGPMLPELLAQPRHESLREYTVSERIPHQLHKLVFRSVEWSGRETTTACPP
jgi:hypothetical protein